MNQICFVRCRCPVLRTIALIQCRRTPYLFPDFLARLLLIKKVKGEEDEEKNSDKLDDPGVSLLLEPALS